MSVERRRRIFRSRTLTCGTATNRQRSLTFCNHAQLGVWIEVGLAASSLDKRSVGTLRLTWCTSSVATLKVQVLEVDLEILLLSFLMPILWDDNMSFHRWKPSVCSTDQQTKQRTHRYTHLSRCPASGELGLDGTSDFTSSVCWQPSKLLCSLRRLRVEGLLSTRLVCVHTCWQER